MSWAELYLTEGGKPKARAFSEIKLLPKFSFYYPVNLGYTIITVDCFIPASPAFTEIDVGSFIIRLFSCNQVYGLGDCYVRV